MLFCHSMKLEDEEEEDKYKYEERQDFCEWFAYKYKFEILFAFLAANAFLSFSFL
jgi:hypothetical protein